MIKVLDITVLITQVTEVESQECIVKMLSFTGNCSGEYFQGEILPGGVDTQVIKRNGKGTMSARYMMKGVDCSGISCNIFIENTAEMNPNGEIKTKPKIITDSEKLAWLQDADLYGKLEMEDGDLHIRVYADKRDIKSF